MGLEEIGGTNEKHPDRERNHKRPLHLPLPSWLEASPLCLHLDAASPPLGFAHWLLSASNHTAKPEDHSNYNPCGSWSHVLSGAGPSQLQSQLLLTKGFVTDLSASSDSHTSKQHQATRLVMSL